MAKKKANPEPLDRVKRAGRMGTVINFHKDGAAVSVLPDDRPRSQGSVVWAISDCEFFPPASRCPLCDERHLVYYCPKGQ